MGKIYLQLNQLSKTYGKIKAVDRLSLTIEKGNVYGLLGPNGSGKSNVSVAAVASPWNCVH